MFPKLENKFRGNRRGYRVENGDVKHAVVLLVVATMSIVEVMSQDIGHPRNTTKAEPLAQKEFVGKPIWQR
ncbi:hypothetical protein CMK12_12090 [Candidatus Poribacteria bacterium]|nr:hypothetical protein [Candidatus Poribacteria bacterium]